MCLIFLLLHCPTPSVVTPTPVHAAPTPILTPTLPHPLSCDTYSLGIVLLEMVTCKKPYLQLSMMGVMTAVTTGVKPDMDADEAR
jgi:serine/threonine protein kinase